jgi:adenylate cyclase
MCDSDLDYLGRSDFIPVSNTLYKELKEQKKIGSLNDWNKIQLNFISEHQYFTKTAQSLREVNKQKQIERIMQIIEPG